MIKQKWSEGDLIPDLIIRVQNLLMSRSGALVGWFKRKDRERVKEIEQLTTKIKEVQEVVGSHNVEFKKLQKEVWEFCWNKRI